MDLVGFPALARAHGVDDAYATVTRCLALMDEIARHHGGAVDRYLGDSLMAIFGFPVASEDSALDAVSAAYEMRIAVESLSRDLGLGSSLGFRIGANTGWLVAGDVEGSIIREFLVMGDAVNVAARLKDLAPVGEIFVGPVTWEATRGAFRFRPLEPTILKGKRERTAVYALGEPVARSAGASWSARLFPRLVARDAELARLRERVVAVARGRGGAIVLEGEDGIGKSRLVAELAIERHGPRFLEAAATRFGSSAPLHVFGELAPGEIRLAAGEAELAVLHALGDRAQREPIVLAAENLQWADPASLRVLAELVPHCRDLPLLLILLGRPPAPAAALRARGREVLGERYLELVVPPLSDAEIERLIDAVGSQEPLPGDVRSLAVERAAGNPSRAIQSVFLSSALRAERSRSGQRSASRDEAERRWVTVLFSDLTGFTALAEQAAPEVLHEIVTDCLARLDAVARRHGGTVEKHLGDCIMAAFGIPVAMEDASRAAVNAAIEMHTCVEAFNRERHLDEPLQVHVGIDAGLAIAGVIRGPVIREYALMGESVGNAAHLKDVAPPGRVYVGEETYRATRASFHYAPVVLSSRETAWELVSREVRLHRDEGRARRGVLSPLVGRGAELASLRREAEDLLLGRGGVVAVIGAAGLGKSRLLQELVSEVGDRALCLQARSLSIGRGLSFHPFRDLLARWCEISDRDDAAAASRKLDAACSALLGESAVEIAPFLAILFGAAPPERDRDRLAQLHGEALGKLILASVTHVLRALAAHRPLLLIFEDLHWADLSSLELLEALLRLAATERILFVSVSRPHFETSERIHAIARERLSDRYREVALEPLSTVDSQLLLRNLFRGGELPHRTLDSIHEKTAGNPFFAEEVVRSLLDAGALEEFGEGLRVTERIHAVAIPGTIQEAIMARVDGLDREQGSLLRVAAVIGESFHQAVLAEVIGKDDLPARIASLVDVELIVRRDRMRGGEYRFKHPLIHEVVYDSIVRSRRQELHLAIGSAIEATLTENTPGYHGMLAYHFSQGNDPDRAEEYLFRAGDEAARAAASDEAIEFFSEASGLYLSRHGESGDREKMAHVERSIAVALANRGRYVEAVAHFDQALRHRGVRVTDRKISLGLRLARDLLPVLGSLYLPAGIQRRRPASDRERAVQDLIYQRARSQTSSAMGRYLFDWVDGLRRLLAVDPRTMPLAGGQLASSIGIFSYGGVSFALAARFLERARDIVDAEDPTDRMIFGFMSSFHHFLAGDWSDDHDVSEQLVEDRIRNAQLFDVTHYLSFHAERRIHQGRFEEAIGEIQRIAEIADLFQYDRARSTVHGLSAVLLLEQEQFAAAAEAALVHYSEHREPLPHLIALGSMAKAQLATGDRASAERSLAKAEKLLADASGVVPPYHASCVLRSRLLFDVDTLECALAAGSDPRAARRQARRSARQACRAVEWVACRRPEVYRLEATRRFLDGDRRGAERGWERAAAAAAALRMEPERRRIEAERARRIGEPPRGS